MIITQSLLHPILLYYQYALHWWIHRTPGFLHRQLNLQNKKSKTKQNFTVNECDRLFFALVTYLKGKPLYEPNLTCIMQMTGPCSCSFRTLKTKNYT